MNTDGIFPRPLNPSARDGVSGMRHRPEATAPCYYPEQRPIAVHGLSFGNQLYPSFQKAWHRCRLDVWVAKQVDAIKPALSAETTLKDFALSTMPRGLCATYCRRYSCSRPCCSLATESA